MNEPIFNQPAQTNIQGAVEPASELTMIRDLQAQVANLSDRLSHLENRIVDNIGIGAIAEKVKQLETTLHKTIRDALGSDALPADAAGKS